MFSEAEFIFTQISAPSFCHAMNPYWLIEFYSISGLIPIPDFMKPASAGRFSLKYGSYLFIQANYKRFVMCFYYKSITLLVLTIQKKQLDTAVKMEK